MMRLEVTPSPEADLPAAEMVTSAVFLAGPHQGAVLIHCEPRVAWELAAHFEGGEPDLTEADEFDVLGEVANMVAGNLKSSLLPGCHLSIPSVIRGADATVRLCGARPVQRAAFDTQVGRLWVTMFAT
jgi:chemotaxis protein CheX